MLCLGVVACSAPTPTVVVSNTIAVPSATAVPTETSTSTAVAQSTPTDQGVALLETSTLTEEPTATTQAPTCEDLENTEDGPRSPEYQSLNCGFPTETPTAFVFRPTPVPPSLTWVVKNQIVTAMYQDAGGTIYYGAAQDADAIADTLSGGYALWKRSPDGTTTALTDHHFNVIGGVLVHNGTIYFNAAGALYRMPAGGGTPETVLLYPTMSKIYGHVNHALAEATIAGQDSLLMAVGSTIDSSYDEPDHPSGVQPPYYEPFPTGRINFASFAWLDQTKNYQVVNGGSGQVYEYARGVRNPWAMTAGVLNGQFHVFAVDNDPSFTPAKLDSEPGAANAGDEVNDIVQGKDYGHPFAYSGEEPAWGDIPPIVTFPNGSVPSGVAVAAGKLFVSLHDAGMIAKVNTIQHIWTPVMTQIQPFNLYGSSNLLYICDFSGIRVVDARGL